MSTGEQKPPTGSQPAAPTTGSQPTAPPQTTEQQLEGLRAWVAQLDRRLGIRTLAGGVALVLALAAGIVGVVLARDAKDQSATKGDVAALSEQVKATGRAATRAAADDIAALTERLDGLESRISTLASSQRTSQSELDVARDDIDELRGQINDLRSEVANVNANAGGGAGGGGP